MGCIYNIRFAGASRRDVFFKGDGQFKSYNLAGGKNQKYFRTLGEIVDTGGRGHREGQQRSREGERQTYRLCGQLDVGDVGQSCGISELALVGDLGQKFRI